VRRTLRIGAGLGLALVVITCTERGLTGPHHPGRGSAAFDFSAWARSATPLGLPPVPIDSLEIVLQRASDGSVSLDKRYGFNPDTLKGDSLVVNVDLSQSPETFTITIRMYGGGIDWYHFTGSVDVTAGAIARPSITGQYVGTGANATRVVIGPVDTTAVGGTAFPLRAQAYDAVGNAISGVPIGYRLSDATRGSVVYPTPYTATLTAARSLRDSVWVVAETPTHLKDSTRLHLIPQPAQLLKVAGDNQGGVIGGTLGAPLVVRLLDALGAGFKGDTVKWSVSGGGATLSVPFTVTDDTGYALVRVIPTALGPVNVQATATPIGGAITGSPASFLATVVTGPSLILGYTTVTAGVGQVFQSEYAQVGNVVTGNPLVVQLQRSDSLATPQVFGLSTNSVVIPVGSSVSSPFSVTGQTAGSAQLIASATGYGQATANVAVGAPRLATSGSLSVFVGAPPTPVPVFTEDQTGATRVVASTVNVSDSSTAPAVAAADSAIFSIAALSNVGIVGVKGVSKGSAAIVFYAPGYRSDTLTVSVDTAPLVLIPPPIGLAVSKTDSMTVLIPFAAPSAVTVALVSSNPAVLAVPPIVTIPIDSSFATFPVTGLVQGTSNVTATATGFYASAPVPVGVGQATGVLVTMVSGLAFSPPVVTIPAGQSVAWQNTDTIDHTTTADSSSAQQWDSGTLAPGATYSVPFPKAGTYTYHCTIHGAIMSGTVVVQ